MDLGSGVVTAEYINRYSTGRDVTLGNVHPQILEEDRLHRTTPDQELMRKISAMRPAYTSRQVLLITSRKQLVMG